MLFRLPLKAYNYNLIVSARPPPALRETKAVCMSRGLTARIVYFLIGLWIRGWRGIGSWQPQDTKRNRHQIDTWRAEKPACKMLNAIDPACCAWLIDQRV